MTAFAATLGLVLAAYPLYALLNGELLRGPGHVSLLAAARFQLLSRTSSGSALVAHTAARRIVDSWMRLDRWLPIGSLIAIAVAPVTGRARALAASLFLPILALVRGGYVPGMFIIGMLPIAALLVAGLADVLWGKHPARRVAVVAALAAAAVVVVPSWVRADRAVADANDTHATWAAERWIETHVDHRRRLIIDDTMWLDLVRHGFDPRTGVVWFYKLDFTNNLDPSVAARLPRGGQDFDYLVSTPTIRTALMQSPTGFQPVRQALAHSAVVATFGTGAGRIDISALPRAGGRAAIDNPNPPDPGRR
jgi:hypothetical protein